MTAEMLLLKKLLTGDMDAIDASSQIATLVSRSADLSAVLPVKRAIDCYRDRKTLDFCGHLRQCLVYLQGELEISREVLSLLEPHAKRFGFTFHNTGARITLNIDPCMLRDVKDLASRFRLVKRKVAHESAGDGELYRCYGYSQYLSEAQKLLMYLIRNQESNETILSCLPTGGGKSLAWELPALSGSLQGMAIVVVPTKALAKDQEKRSRGAFSRSVLTTGLPTAYYGSLSDLEKNSILEEISSGRIPILYVSPEALLQERFKSAVLEAAKRGFVGMLVIDEAHLVVQWGRHFRPEFQLLSVLRNQLQEVSPHGLKTLLLSATLTDDDTNVLKTVFKSDSFTEYRADALRSEPEYYTHICKSARERSSLVDRLVAVAPRPIILYVATPEQASEHYERLRETGYRNCATFTGQTNDSESSHLVDLWRSHELDIMIATSAFGMGVDLADLRTIITAYIPESISRFYQEVGRAGRDGYASLNYWLPEPEEDSAIIHNLTKSAVLTEESLVQRWISLLHAGVHVKPDTVWLDMYHAPEHLMYGYTGEKNKNWNIDTILFLTRCGLLEILELISNAREDYRILVHMLNISVLESPKLLLSQLRQHRAAERASIDESMALVREMMRNKEHYCYADYFVQDFPYAPSQCSGCPACRVSGTEPYSSETKPETASTKASLFHRKTKPAVNLLSDYLSFRNEIHLVAELPLPPESLFNCIAKLVNSGVNMILYPPDTPIEPMVKRLSAVKGSNYLLITLYEAEELPSIWFKGTLALFYTDDPDYNRRLYSFCARILRESPDASVVHVANSDTYIEARQKALRETVDCSVKLSAIE